MCDYSNESYWAYLPRGVAYHAKKIVLTSSLQPWLPGFILGGGEGAPSSPNNRDLSLVPISPAINPFNEPRVILLEFPLVN